MSVCNELRCALGLDLIITDHHEPGTELPAALAVINPKRHDCGYPDKNLAGVGVVEAPRGTLTHHGVDGERAAGLLPRRCRVDHGLVKSRLSLRIE
mgnify:CR=1 FL=1